MIWPLLSVSCSTDSTPGSIQLHFGRFQADFPPNLPSRTLAPPGQELASSSELEVPSNVRSKETEVGRRTTAWGEGAGIYDVSFTALVSMRK